MDPLRETPDNIKPPSGNQIKLFFARHSDIFETERFLRKTIRFAFEQDGIGDQENNILSEITSKTQLLRQAVETNHEQIHFWCARIGREIAGTIALIPPENLILEYLDIVPEKVPEISTVYVHPEYQRQGIGTKMFHAVLDLLQQRRFTRFCLDCGYQKSQEFWIHRLGSPDVTLKNYWGPGINHMIWIRETGAVHHG